MTLLEIEQASLASSLPVVKPIFSTTGSRLIAVGMKAGLILKEHIALTKTKIMVIKGEVDFNTQNESRRLGTYDSYDIPVHLAHTVEAYDDALFLLLTE
jgi:hypothetical protein